jgi:hypothetical protein
VLVGPPALRCVARAGCLAAGRPALLANMSVFRGSGGDPRYVVAGEAMLVVSALRRNARWSAVDDDVADPLLKGFAVLKHTLAGVGGECISSSLAAAAMRTRIPTHHSHTWPFAARSTQPAPLSQAIHGCSGVHVPRHHASPSHTHTHTHTHTHVVPLKCMSAMCAVAHPCPRACSRLGSRRWRNQCA